MKKLITLCLLAVGITAQAQNADPYLSIQTIPSVVSLNSNSTLQVIAGNAGNNTIVANSLRVVISAGSNSEILGLSGVGDDRWSVTLLGAGTGNTIVLTNSGGASTMPFSTFDLVPFEVLVKGTVVGGASTISANIGYITANNPLISGALNASQGDANTTNNNSITSLTVITSPLLVRLNDITVTGNLCTAMLAWSTSSEENFSRFEIEHSANSRDFSVVGTVNGTGGASTGASYRFAYDQSTGKGYYRLKMIDRDGTISYSKVVAVATKCNEKTVTINPNPVFENQNVTVTLSGYDGKVKGELFAVTGQMLASYNLQNGLNSVKLSNLLAKGTYQLRVTAETGEAQSYKIVLMK